MGFVDFSHTERDPKTGRVPRPPFDVDYRFATSSPSRGHVHRDDVTVASGLAPASPRPFPWLASPTPPAPPEIRDAKRAGEIICLKSCTLVKGSMLIARQEAYR